MPPSLAAAAPLPRSPPRCEPSPAGEEAAVLITSLSDDGVLELTPSIPRVPSAGSIASKRRRRPQRVSAASRRRSFGREVSHAAAETFLMARLAFRLLRYLGVGYRWISKTLALACYAMLLLPGFLKVGYYYFFSSQVRRNVVYGEQPRNCLDLYLPTDTSGPKPVVAFVTGGAWIIGIYLVGQSAGAHIAACTLLFQATKECGEGKNTTWSVSQMKAFFGLSGGYNMLNLVDYFHRRGLYRSIFLSIMEGEEGLKRFSPEIVVKDVQIRHAVSLLPQTILFHGTDDYSIPCDASKTFAGALRSVGVEVKLVLYKGKTHTDIFLQDPLRGGRDELVENIAAVIHSGDPLSRMKDVVAPPAPRLVPEFMLQLARRISPF